MLQTVEKWLTERCPEDHIALKDGILYIPIDTMERKLDGFYRFNSTWNTENFQSKYLQTPDGELLVSASIELVISGQYARRLVGATTFRASDYHPNMFYDAIAKSLCVVNAAYDLGDQFGRFLGVQNKEIANVPSGNSSTKNIRSKMKPDTFIRSSYETAKANGNEKMIKVLEETYDFNA